MITVEFDETIVLKYLLLDYTGTLSENGKLIDGVRKRLNELSKLLEIEVLTSDTFGSARSELKGIDCTVNIIDGKAKEKKLKRLQDLGADNCVAIGNGHNDMLMLKHARLSIAVINAEGCYAKLISQADIVARSINDALDILLDKRKIIAVLRH